MAALSTRDLQGLQSLFTPLIPLKRTYVKRREPAQWDGKRGRKDCFIEAEPRGAAKDQMALEFIA
jgi:hypothetical protein